MKKNACIVKGGGEGGIVQTNTVNVMITMWTQMLELFD